MTEERRDNSIFVLGLLLAAALAFYGLWTEGNPTVVVIFIYRDDFYHKDSDTPTLAEINVAKHRNGPTGSITLRFDKSHAKFANLESYAFSDEELEQLVEQAGDW